MEVAASAKSGYYKSAYDASRAEMLNQVAAAWETPIADKVEFPVVPELGGIDGGIEMTVSAMIQQTIVPKVNLDEVTLEEAVEFLRTVKTEDGKSVNFTVNLGPQGSPVADKIRDARFSMQLTNVPVVQVLKYITDATQTSFTTDDYAVVISPAGFTTAELVARTYRVPPDFVTNISTAAAGGAPASRMIRLPKTNRVRIFCKRASASRTPWPNKVFLSPKVPAPATLPPPTRCAWSIPRPIRTSSPRWCKPPLKPSRSPSSCA